MDSMSNIFIFQNVLCRLISNPSKHIERSGQKLQGKLHHVLGKLRDAPENFGLPFLYSI